MMPAAAIGPPCRSTRLPAALAGRAHARRLGPDDFPGVRALNDTVIAGIDDPDLAVLETDAFLRDHLAGAGATLGVVAGGALVACSVLGLPAADDPYNFGFDIGADAAVRASVAHLDGCVIRPDWRGHGLQRALTEWRIALAAEAGRKLVLSAASPRNVYSLRNLLQSGLAIVDLKEKFGGRLRFILRKDIGAPAPAGPDGDLVPLPDLAGHRARLVAGGRGVAIVLRGGQPCVRYRRPRGPA